MTAPMAIDRVHYDPTTESFWALVRFDRFGMPYTYVVEVEAPITAGFDDLAPLIADAGLAAHLEDKALLRSFLRAPAALSVAA